MKSISNCAHVRHQQSNLEIAEVPYPDTDNVKRNTILIAIIQNPGIRYRGTPTTNRSQQRCSCLPS